VNFKEAQTRLTTRANGSQEFAKAKEFSDGQMAVTTMETGSVVSTMDKARLDGRTA